MPEIFHREDSANEASQHPALQISGAPEMQEHVLGLRAPQDRVLHVWFEPWAEGLAFPAGSAVELRAVSDRGGGLEVDATPERTAVYGWPGSTLRVLVGGAEVLSFLTLVPDGLSREKVTLLFGEPPVPTAEGGGVVARPWWRFWR